MLLVAAYLGAMTAVLHFLGVGGYRAGFLWVALLLCGGTAGLSLLVLTTMPNRALWAVAAAVLGLVASARLVDVAPPSAGSLAARIDALDLPLFEKIDHQRSGHSWCRPHCPRVVHTYDAPDTAPFAAVHAVVLALAQKKIVVVPPPGAERIRVRHGDVSIDVLARSRDGDVSVVIDYRVVD